MSDMTQSKLLEALQAALVTPAPEDAPGLTVAEIAVEMYGINNSGSRLKVSQLMRPLVDSGQIVRGWRYMTRIDGHRLPVAVFARAA